MQDIFAACPWLLKVLGYTVPFWAHFIVGPIVTRLWNLTEAEFKSKGIVIPPEPVRPPKNVSLWHGVVERAVYLACIVLGKPEGIAVWLGFKAVIRWKIAEDKDPCHAPGAPIYMIGTALNVPLGSLAVFSFLDAGRCNGP